MSYSTMAKVQPPFKLYFRHNFRFLQRHTLPQVERATLTYHIDHNVTLVYIYLRPTDLTCKQNYWGEKSKEGNVNTKEDDFQTSSCGENIYFLKENLFFKYIYIHKGLILKGVFPVPSLRPSERLSKLIRKITQKTGK